VLIGWFGYGGWKHESILFMNNYTNSKFVQQPLENDHAFGKLDGVMKIMYFIKKGHKYTIEKFK
jgi:hypothetical protein